MSRLSALAAHPRRTVAALAVVLAAVGITVGSGANFTASAANPSNTFTAGTLSVGNGPASALFNATNLRPGDNVPGTVDIQNSGSLSGSFTLTSSSLVDNAGLLGQLDLKVEDCGLWTTQNSVSTAPACNGTTYVYTGAVSGVRNVPLGNFAGGAKHRYKVDVTMPSGIANSFQGTTGSVQFDWNATA